MTEAQLKIDSRIHLLEGMPSKIQYLEGLIEEEFKKFDQRITDFQYTSSKTHQQHSEKLDR